MIRAILQLIGSAYLAQVRKAGVEARFLATMGFLATFLVTRGWTAIAYARGDRGHLNIGGTHIHHMVPGLGLVLTAGILSLDSGGRSDAAISDLVASRPAVAGALFGSGAALVLDEFSLILFVEDAYWQERGVQMSLVAVGVIGAGLVLNLYVGRRFYGEVRTVGASALAER